MMDFLKVVNFIREQFEEPTGYIPLHAPVFKGNEKIYINECIDSTFVSSAGKFVDRFEVEIANYIGVKKAVACVNGTSALHLALRLAGVQSGNEVITQPLTFIATINAITYCGAQPVFIDVDSDTLGMSPKSLLDFLISGTTQRFNRSTKKYECINNISGRTISACLPMHTFGHPCRINEIVDICKRYNLIVIEDAAESLGSFFNEKHTGTFGEIGVLSFNGNKILTTGGGGMLLFQDEELARFAKHLSTQAKLPHPWEFIHDEVGYNYRMPNINAALGLAQLEKLQEFLKSKRLLAMEYKKFFDSINISFVKEPNKARSNYWLNCILLKNKNERDRFLKFSNDNGVMTRPAWELMNLLPIFKGCQVAEIQNAINISERLVNLPSSVR